MLLHCTNSRHETVLTSSLECFDQARLHTCDPVSTHCRGWPVNVFQKRIHWSAVPPPLASRPCWCGDHAMAFTAARCSVYVWTGLLLVTFHTNSLLSLPPLARCWWSGDHFSPHTWQQEQHGDTSCLHSEDFTTHTQFHSHIYYLDGTLLNCHIATKW